MSLYSLFTHFINFETFFYTFYSKTFESIISQNKVLTIDLEVYIKLARKYLSNDVSI